ncbi:SCO family protein [Myxococcota bacterium]|nr:SCO family protein [Myxococcota bacterium]
MVLALALGGCSLSSDPPLAPDPGAPTAGDAAPDAAPDLGASIYQLAAPLTDQSGAEVGLDAFRGHPVLISMFYASCPAACPMLIRDIQSIEAAVPPEARADLRVLLISLDPDRDTPPALAALAERHRVDPTRWKVTRTPQDRVREIAAVLGIQYRFLPDGELNHSSVITLLDPQGIPLHRAEGLGRPQDDMVARIAALPRR